ADPRVEEIIVIKITGKRVIRRTTILQVRLDIVPGQFGPVVTIGQRIAQFPLGEESVALRRGSQAPVDQRESQIDTVSRAFEIIDIDQTIFSASDLRRMPGLEYRSFT